MDNSLYLTQYVHALFQVISKQEEAIKTLNDQLITLGDKIESRDIDDDLRNSNYFSELECSLNDLEQNFEDKLLNSDTLCDLREKITEISEPQGFISDIGSQSLIESYKNELESILHRLDKLEEAVNK